MRTVWVGSGAVVLAWAVGCSGRSTGQSSPGTTAGSGGSGTAGSSGRGSGGFSAESGNSGRGGGSGSGGFFPEGGSGGLAGGGWSGSFTADGGSGARRGGNGGVGGFDVGGRAEGGAGDPGGTAGRGGVGGSAGSAGAGAESAAGGTGGMAGDGAGGESACSCETVVLDRAVRMVACDVPLEAMCCPAEPITCATTLDDALAAASLDIWCQNDEATGLISDCSDGTSELAFLDYTRDSTVRFVIDAADDIIGKYYVGYSCPELYRDGCGFDPGGSVDAQLYETGDLAVRTCFPRCELCTKRHDPNAALPRCP